MKLLLIEAFIFLGRARILKKVPFSKVAPSLGKHMEETSFSDDVSNRKILNQISDAVNMMSKYTLWESQCLVQAIAAMKMLERRHIESTLYLGTARDPSGKLIAHAWLRSGPFCITGADGKEKFTVVSKFAKSAGYRNK
jgi:hypothetical protein